MSKDGIFELKTIECPFAEFNYLNHVVLYCTFYNLYKLRCRHFNRRPEQLDLSAQKSAVPCMVFMHLRGFLAFQSIDLNIQFYTRVILSFKSIRHRAVGLQQFVYDTAI
jgi:hypothetical protein